MLALERAPDMADGPGVLSQPGGRRRERRGEPSLYVAAYLGPEAEDVASVRGPLQFPCRNSGEHRAPREREGHGRAERHPAGVLAGDGQVLERIPGGFGDEQPVEAALLGLAAAAGHLVQRGTVEIQIDFHGGTFEIQTAKE